jgi:hypothetical protein
MSHPLISVICCTFSEPSPTGKPKNDIIIQAYPHLNLAPLTGFLQDVSSVKISRNNYSYFNFKVQTEQHVVHGVCFDAQLHTLVKDKELTQQSLKLSNYTLKHSISSPSSKSIVLNRRSKVEPIECTFNFVSCISESDNSNNTHKISHIQDINDYTSVTVYGQVAILREAESITLSNKVIKKMECKIADETDSIRLIVWAEHIDSVKHQQFYCLEKVTVRTFQSKKYLSIGVQTTITETSPMSNIVDSFFQNIETHRSIQVLSINGITAISKYALCISCNKKLSDLQSNIKKCEVCGMMQRVLPENTKQFSVSIFVREENLTLTLFNDPLQQLLTIYQHQSDNNIVLQEVSDQELTEAILGVSDITIVYDIDSKIVQHIV